MSLTIRILLRTAPEQLEPALVSRLKPASSRDAAIYVHHLLTGDAPTARAELQRYRNRNVHGFFNFVCSLLIDSRRYDLVALCLVESATPIADCAMASLVLTSALREEAAGLEPDLAAIVRSLWQGDRDRARASDALSEALWAWASYSERGWALPFWKAFSMFATLAQLKSPVDARLWQLCGERFRDEAQGHHDSYNVAVRFESILPLAGEILDDIIPPLSWRLDVLEGSEPAE